MCTHQPINGTRAPIGRGLNVVQSVVSTSSINSRETLENRVMVKRRRKMDVPNAQDNSPLRDLYQKYLTFLLTGRGSIPKNFEYFLSSRHSLFDIDDFVLTFRPFFYDKFHCSLYLQLFQPRPGTWMVLERKFSYKSLWYSRHFQRCLSLTRC